MSNTTETDYHKKRLALNAKKTSLEEQITNCTDDKKAALLRADYRHVIDELELFYNDEPEGKL